MKSETRANHVQHLEKAFRLIWEYNMKLNLAKCAFGVSARKFLGFRVIQRGIEVNSTQVKVVLETPTLSSKKELQRLISHLVVLGCFIARFIDKLWHFFLTLNEVNTFDRIGECKRTFEAIKHYLTKPPILSNAKSDEELFMYLVVFDCAVNAVLFWHIWDKE